MGVFNTLIKKIIEFYCVITSLVHQNLFIKLELIIFRINFLYKKPNIKN